MLFFTMVKGFLMSSFVATAVGVLMVVASIVDVDIITELGVVPPVAVSLTSVVSFVIMFSEDSSLAPFTVVAVVLVSSVVKIGFSSSGVVCASVMSVSGIPDTVWSPKIALKSMVPSKSVVTLSIGSMTPSVVRSPKMSAKMPVISAFTVAESSKIPFVTWSSGVVIPFVFLSESTGRVVSSFTVVSSSLISANNPTKERAERSAVSLEEEFGDT